MVILNLQDFYRIFTWASLKAAGHDRDGVIPALGLSVIKSVAHARGVTTDEVAGLPPNTAVNDSYVKGLFLEAVDRLAGKLPNK